jgi:dTMP kinase
MRYYPIMTLRNFIVFEGIDGTGTTTQLRILQDRYHETRGAATSTVFTCEPTSGEIGKLIRRCLKGELSYNPDTLARLFAADRCEHLHGAGGIVELCESGNAVFTDRYLFSSLAYQGETGDPGLPELLNRDFPYPAFLFFFDIDPEISMARVESRAGNLEIFEKREFQKKVRARYLDVIARAERECPEMRVIRVDATEPIEEISRKIWDIAQNLPIL